MKMTETLQQTAAPALNLSLLMAGLLTLLTAFSAQALDKPHIQVTGEGQVEAMPDFIRLHISIEKTGKNQAAVKQQVDGITQQVLDAATQLGIDDKHIEASQLAIHPQYSWHEGKRSLTGQTVQRGVAIKLYKLAQYSALAEAMAALDISRMNHQGFGYDAPEKHRNIALVKALKKARAKAALIAKTLGRKLDGVYQVSESTGFSNPAPVHRAEVMSMAADKPAGAPLDIKPQTVTATVNLIYLLD